LNAFLQNLGVPIGEANKIQDWQEARKYMTQYANQTSSGQTNDRLAATMSGSPNMKLQQATNVDLAKIALINKRINQVAFSEFSRSGLAPASFPQWKAQWLAQQDVRAFGADLMTREARSKLKFSSDAEAQKYYRSWQRCAAPVSNGPRLIGMRGADGFGPAALPLCRCHRPRRKRR
jgi:hypothetical protein